MTEPVEIKIWSDYVCPFCMLAEGPLQEATHDLDVEIEWMPFELRRYPVPTLRPEEEYLPSIWKRAVYPMARRLGVGISLPTISPQPYTRLAFEGYQYAAEHGQGTAYTRRMFRAFFQEDRDIGQIDVLTALAGEAGLDEAEFRTAVDSGTYRDKHEEALREAETHRIRSVPTLLVDHIRITGVPHPAVLRKAILDAHTQQDALHGTACSLDGGC